MPGERLQRKGSTHENVRTGTGMHRERPNCRLHPCNAPPPGNQNDQPGRSTEIGQNGFARTDGEPACAGRVGVLVGSPAAGRKSTRLGRHGICALPLPGGELDAPGVHKAVSMLDLDQIELLLIEGSGDMQSLSQRNHGQDLCVSVFSVADGPDQPNSFPHLIAAADLVLLTMVDLLPTTKFDLSAFLLTSRESGPTCR